VCYPPAVLQFLIALFLIPTLQAQPTTTCANIWKDRTGEVEEFLRTAKVEKVADIPIGVTRPRRAFLAPGGMAGSFAWKVLPPGTHDGYFESYKSEIAAYELDKILGLNMVPVVVERRVNNDVGAAVLWLDGVRSWETVLPLPKPASWNREIARMKMFDDLIGNSDRNKGNLLVDDDWHLFLIDHSRAFATATRLPQELQSIDRRLWDNMLKLDAASLKQSLGQWLDSRQIQMLLRRRDAMKKKIEALAAKAGASVFF
jgi:Phosphatidylinositol 3- and 4-kinase